mgnify:CR=1 FL=1
MTKKRLATAARQLLSARRSGFKLEGLAADLVPTGREEAYLVQELLVLQSEEALGGWKVAVGTGSDPVCSPILLSAYRTGNEPIDLARTMANLVEAEIGVRFGSDLPPRDEPYRDDEVAAAIEAIHPTLEILGSRFTERAEVSELINVADLQRNSAVIVGQAWHDWRQLDLSSEAIVLRIGHADCGTNVGPAIDDIIATLTWLANGRAMRFGGLKAGQIVITGSRVNAPIGTRGEMIEARFGTLGPVTLVSV